MPANDKKKIAILGGGVGSMTTALWLTQVPNWQERYEITVYQMGWRLGGKGASGRNAAFGDRIEEHGLHIWFGFYENAFKGLRLCYEALNRPKDQPLSKIYAEPHDPPDGNYAFKPHPTGSIEDYYLGKWTNWQITFPENDDRPGVGGEFPSMWACIQTCLAWLQRLLEKEPTLLTAMASSQSSTDPGGKEIHDLFHAFLRDVGMERPASPTHLHRASVMANALPPPSNAEATGSYLTLLRLITEFLEEWQTLAGDKTELPPNIYHVFVLLDLGLTVIKGLLADGLLVRGLDVADNEELMPWLARHGAHYHTMQSPFLRGLYDIPFAFENGDLKQPNLAAGVAIRCMMRICFTYKGSLMWKMQAGMGDTIFTPMYQVLSSRGVQFRFFHEVTALRVSSFEPKSISAIKLNVQANVKSGGEYQPLKLVNQLPCWPSEPDYDQLVEGELIRNGLVLQPLDQGRQPYNLESHWSGWKNPGQLTLRAGADFDIVVLGIALGALPAMTAELSLANPAWATMVSQVKTIRTQAMQLWMNDPYSALGWRGENGVVMDAYYDPINTMSDMSHLLPRENWTGPTVPQSVVYFCGPMPDDPNEPGPEQTTYPAQERNKVLAMGTNWLSNYTEDMWPNASVDGKGFNWNLLFDTAKATGAERMKSQFFRSNIDPTERYVLSVARSTAARLASDNSGFSNLYLAGDWTLNGLNVGCVEAATMSGMFASKAICGEPSEIIGA